MIFRVRWLEDASHTVRLARGSSEDGNRNGKMLSPAVAMIDAIPMPLATKPRPGRPARSAAGVIANAMIAAIGTVAIQGNDL